ncbi:MAG: hypothetical protein IT209_07830 [Armatimonadetes bacterium]|nr:hypothetical protein [Armatimonadota bacterium]
MTYRLRGVKRLRNIERMRRRLVPEAPLAQSGARTAVVRDSNEMSGASGIRSAGMGTPSGS